ncbi:MAG: pyridoxal phosphate-dependent aminotransferase [Nitrososphaeria archaeon]|nr:pyridoxal phosphate-dependent aminotransferase [Aigarchaeota archaeon]MCX8187430.1 pyridoxal phosphate-dependent aminotransferase [Nitrososphaeria archaeon]MDW8021110.1 pyridoxal phosphate-dependent aminotransferase [Nitrososphaerota archaeon]
MGLYGVPKRIKGVKAEAAFVILEVAKKVEAAGRKIIHLEIGDTCFDTPEHIKEAAVEAIRRGETHYTPTPGMQELREAIAESVKIDYGVDVDWDKNVVVTNGCKQAVLAATLSIVDEGDEVLYPDPGYPGYEAAICLAGGKPIPYKLSIENNFRINVEEVAELITPKTKLLMINTPENPCGSIANKNEVKALVELSEDYGFYILSDEIYRPIIFDGEKHHSPLEIKGSLDRIIIADGFSKRYAMTGWRVGYALTPKEITQQVIKLLNVMTSCPSSISQWAALAALKGPQEPVSQMIKEYERLRNIAIKSLSEIDVIRFVKPLGAFSLMIDIRKALERLGMKSEQFIQMLIEKYGVAFLHGSAFGSYGEGFMRMTFTTLEENIIEGTKRLKQALDEIFRS